MNAVTQDNSILFPPGRIVQGDLYEANDKDMQGNPLTTKTGNNIGKPRVEYFFAYAIPKTRAVWWEEGTGTDNPWGPKILTLAQGWWPQGQTGTPRFSWKITDGDDATPNPEANMRRNCDREGFPGHWVVRMSSGFATKIFDEQGTPLLTPGLVKRGFWIEAFCNVNSNENPQKPGIYINHQYVAYRAPGKEIVSGPDPRAIGFGRAALPAGVTAQPLGNSANMPAMPSAPGAQPAVPGGMPAMPHMPAMPAPGQPSGTPPMPGQPAMPGRAMPPMPGQQPMPPAQVAVQPQAAFLYPPGAGAAPPVPAAAAAPMVPTVVCPLGAPPGHKMVNLNGARYEAFRAQGWTDVTMIQGGHMVRL